MKLFFENDDILRSTLSNYKGKSVSFHVEDASILSQNVNKETHDQQRPIIAIEIALAYVLNIIEEFDIKAKLCHWSCTGESIKMIQQHRNKGYKTTIEVSPLNLFFSTMDTTNHPERWPYLQMNPSLQSSIHQQELIQLLRTGFIDYIATDHAPHTLSEKFKNFENSEELYLSFLHHNKPECISKSKMDCISGTRRACTHSE